MSTAPLRLQDLRRRRDAQAQAAPPWRFWGVCVHVCQREPLWEASRLATDNHGAPGSAGGPFEAIAAAGGETCLAPRRDALVHGPSRPRRDRRQAIPQGRGPGVRVLASPALRDRVVQGALTRIVEPLVAADFPAGS